MKLLWALRISLYLQLLLGLGRAFGFGFLYNPRVWEWHIFFGVLSAVLALIALRPLPALGASGIRTAARFIGLAPLALGLLLLFNVYNASIVGTHMLLGIATVALVEMAAARQRRSLAHA